MEAPRIYSLTQLLGLPTIRRYQAYARKYVPPAAGRRVLEIGCGVGSSRPLFTEDYTGIDINPDYIASAKAHFTGNFYVMDAAHLSFEPNSFDDAVSIATTHHLSDVQLAAMVSKAVIVARKLHIIDAILPLSTAALFKRTYFKMDRGRFVRTADQLRAIVAACVRVECQDAVKGALHDVCYIRASQVGHDDSVVC
jgi:SAM-dependent methyltransferase